MIKKQGPLRKKEILDKSMILFTEKGYEKTTVEDILEKVGIKKGTLYYYFESKEQILDALAWREAEKKFEITRDASESKSMNAVEKLNKIITEAQKINFSGFEAKTGILKAVSDTDYCRLNQKLSDCSLAIGIPLLEQIIKQGLKEGFFHTEYPHEAAQLYIVMMNSMKKTFGSMLINFIDKKQIKEDIINKIMFYQDILENIFKCKKGVLCFAGISLELIEKIYPEA